MDTVAGSSDTLPLSAIPDWHSDTAVVSGQLLDRQNLYAPLYHQIYGAVQNHAFEKLSRKRTSAFSNENTSLYIFALSNNSNTIENDYLVNIFNLVDQYVESFTQLLEA